MPVLVREMTDDEAVIAIDTFLNSIYVYDDRLVFTYNYRDGTETLTLKDIEAAFGSDMKNCSPP